MPFVKKTHSQDSQPLPEGGSPIFIGRTGELLFFVHNILKPEAPTHNILSISGQGGVGKSTLLGRFIAEAHEDPFKDYCLTASVDERQTSPVSIMEKLAQQLHLTGKFEKALRQYKEALQRQQVERKLTRDRLFESLPDLAGAIVEGIPVAGPLLREGAKITASHLLKEHQASLIWQDRELLETPIDDLTRAFVTELNRLADVNITLSSTRQKRQRRIILFFDTFEQPAAETTPWLLDHFLEAQVSSNVVLVVAGRDPIEHTSKRWLPYCDNGTIYWISLNSFTEDETRMYLVKRGITDADQIANIWHLSRGLPLYLGLLTSNTHEEDIDPTKDVVVNFLRWIPEQESIKRQLALDAALFSKPFNQDDLEVFSYVPESDRSLLYQWLTEQPFVRSRSQDGRYLYHDVARNVFSRHFYQRSQKGYYEIRRALATYYQQLLEKIQAERGKEVYRSEEWLELLQAVIFQLLLLQDQASHIRAIECILYASKHTSKEQDTTIAMTLRDISQEPSPNHISPATREIAVQLLHYIESVRRKDQVQEWLAASETLLKTIANAPSFPSELLADIYMSRGSAYFSLKEHQRAIENFQQAQTLGKKPEDVGLILAYRKLGEREQSFAYFNRLVALNPTDPWAYNRRGWNYFYFGEHKLAIADFDRVLTLDPSSDSAYLGKGWVYYNLREDSQAIAALTRALELNPHLGYAYGCLGLIYQKRRDYQRAAINLDHFVEVNPKNGNAYAYRGYFLQDSQKYQQALVDFDRAVELSPNDSDSYYGRGLTHLWLKNLQQAQSDFTRSCELEPTQTRQALMAEWAWMCQGEANQNSLERLEAIVAACKDPNSYTAHNCRGIALLLREHFVEALAELEQALLLNRNRWDASFWKGVTCAFLGQDEEVIVAIEKAVELGMPPILLTPLRWLEQERPDFYGKYVVPLLTKHA